MNQEHQKAPRWAWKIAWALITVGLLVLLSGILSHYLPTGEQLGSWIINKVRQKASAANPYQLPYGVVGFTLAPGETSPWIATPPGSVYNISFDKQIQICFSDGFCRYLGANDHNDEGVRRGVFQISAYEEETRVAVTIERR